MIETQTQQQTRSTVVPFRVRPREFDLMRQFAQQDDLPVSAWGRAVVLAEVLRKGPCVD